MKINLEIIPKPFVTEFTMCATPMMNILKETKTVTVEGYFHTKTRVNTTLQIGESRTGINLPISGFKTDEVSEYSYLNNEHEYPCYFKASKKQGREAYIKYIKRVMVEVIRDYFSIELDELTIKLILPTRFEINN